MECPRCRFESPPGFRFCGQCGERLPAACPSCGAEAPAGFKFCGQCGSPLGAAPAPRPGPAAVPVGAAAPAPARPATVESEIKQVTVLVCELAEPEGGDPAGPEARHAALNRLLEIARDEVARYEGLVQSLPHGLQALFGAPVAYEDHARRAVLAAGGLQARLADAFGRAGERRGWSARLGLDSGPVVVGGEVAVGETPERAQRLAALAPGGEVLIADATRAIAGGGLPLEPAEGPAAELRAWRLAPSHSPATTAGRGPRRSPFVGRARELEVLDDLRRVAESGEGQVAVLVGEAGAGKSRLLSEFHGTLEGRPLSLLRGHCLSYGRGVPYLPFIELVRRTTGVRDGDSAAEARSKLEERLTQLGVDPEGSLPYLLHLIGYAAGAEAIAEAEPQAVQERTFATMRRIILAAAARSLVVLELEDLHWIDHTSERFLESLVETLPAARVLVIGTYRTGYQPPWLERSYCTQINLRRLTDRDSQSLVGSILGDSAHGAELAADILARGGGNPFFLEELAYSAVESGGTAGYSVPGTLQGVLMARLDRLPRAHKRLLQTASVMAQEISPRMLEELWEDEERPAELIEDLLRWEFLVRVPEEDEPLYLFRHALAREVAYQSLLGRRRRELHARVAVALERLYADQLEEVYDLLIHHYPRAGDAERTVHYLMLFAARAARSYSHNEAAQALREALEQVEQLPPEIRDRRRVEVLLRLAESLLPLAGFTETLERFAVHAETVARLADPALTAQYHFWLAHTHTYLGNREETADHAGRAIEAAHEAHDEGAEGRTCYVLGREGFWSGRFAEGIESSLRAVVLLERSGEPWWQGQAYWVAGFNHFALGQFEAALEALERARDIGDALAEYRLDPSWSLGFLYAALGHSAEGIEHCRRGVERARDPLNSAVANGFLGYALLASGDVAAATESLDSAIRSMRSAGMRQLQSWFASFLAEAYRLAGRPNLAVELAEEGLEAAEESDFRYGAGLAQRELGRIHGTEGRAEDAARRLREALATFEALGMPFEIASTRLDLARLAHGRDDAGAVESELEAARVAFAELELPDQVGRVDRLAAELGAAAGG